MNLDGETFELRAHPCFLEVWDDLQGTVQRMEKAGTYRKSHPKVKLFGRVHDIIHYEIPANPTGPQFRLGNTLGPEYRHWHRAKFLGRFRLFFRYRLDYRIIVYAWMNDEQGLRKAGDRHDPYAVFTRRLSTGRPPDDWEQLLRESRALGASGNS